jgi:O-antigen ligase
LTYVAVAPVGILLTGSRGAFVAGIVALSIVPLTLTRISRRSLVLIPSALVVVLVMTTMFVPGYIWDRMFTISQEIAGQGTLTGRIDIWRAGWEAFLDRPVLGAGGGAFGAAVESVILERRMQASHNAFLAVLVEQGITGLAVFAALLGACAWVISRLPPPERKLWGVVMLTWFVGVMSVGWQYRKLTWLLFGLLAAQETLQWARTRAPLHRGSASPPGSQGARKSHDWRDAVAAAQQ